MNTTLPWLLNPSVAALIIFGIVGCSQNHHAKRVVAESPMALGTKSDDIWRLQEENAAAAKFIVYDHEFLAPDVNNGMTSGGWRLNAYGEDHVKQIAANLNRGDIYPVIVERSQITPDPQSLLLHSPRWALRMPRSGSLSPPRLLRELLDRRLDGRIFAEPLEVVDRE